MGDHPVGENKQWTKHIANKRVSPFFYAEIVGNHMKWAK